MPGMPGDREFRENMIMTSDYLPDPENSDFSQEHHSDIVFTGSLEGQAQPSTENTYRYALMNILGSGGFADIYLCKDIKLNRLVALKLSKNSIFADSDTAIKFKTETQNAAVLEHPNIIRIYDMGIHDNRYFAVMEYVEGQDLRDAVISVRQFQLKILRNIFIQIAKAVDYLHRKGFVHCDLKPENILIDREGTVKIIDFSLMRSLSGIPEKRSGSHWGTPHYMSPETIEGDRFDHRADIYSIGVMFYEMRTGTLPFEGNPNEVLHHHLLTTPKLPSRRSITISASEDKIIMKCLEKNPDNRYQNAAELLGELRRLDISTNQLEDTDSRGPCSFSYKLHCDKDLETKRTLFPLINASGNKSNLLFDETADEAIRSMGSEPLRMGRNLDSFADFCRLCQIISSSRAVIANVSNLTLTTSIQIGMAMGAEKRFLLLEGPDADPLFFHGIFPVTNFIDDRDLSRIIKTFIKTHDEEIKKSSPCFFRWQFHCHKRPHRRSPKRIFLGMPPRDREELLLMQNAIFPALSEMGFNYLHLSKGGSQLANAQDVFENLCILCKGINTAPYAILDVGNMDNFMAFILGTFLGAKTHLNLVYREDQNYPKSLEDFKPLKLSFLNDVIDVVHENIL
jgi:serine/threonine protein kinase